MLVEDAVQELRQHFFENYTETILKGMIVVWAIFVIILVLFFVNNKWLLAGILAYEVLP